MTGSFAEKSKQGASLRCLSQTEILGRPGIQCALLAWDWGRKIFVNRDGRTAGESPAMEKDLKEREVCSGQEKRPE